MLPHPNAWSKQTHTKGRGREVKLINPQNLARIPVRQQSYCSDSLTDEQHSVTQHFTHLILTAEPQSRLRTTTWSHLDPSWQIQPHTGVAAVGDEAQQWHLGEGTCTEPSTHTQVQAGLQTCQDSYWFNSHPQKTVPLFTTELPHLMLPQCTHITFAAGRLKAPWAGSINHFLYKKSSNWQSAENWAGTSNSFSTCAQSKSELSLLK